MSFQVDAAAIAALRQLAQSANPTVSAAAERELESIGRANRDTKTATATTIALDGGQSDADRVRAVQLIGRHLRMGRW